MKERIKLRVWIPTQKKMITDTQEFMPLKITNFGILRFNPNYKEKLYEFVKGDDNQILMVSTGSKDKNGNPIYENDIVTLIREWGNDEYSDIGVIKFHNLAWHIDIDSEDTEPLYASKVYVIGNIYENPELLK